MSEVARLKKQIEMECEAMKLAMTGFRMAASHDIINHRYDQLGVHYERLEEIIGKQAAFQVVMGALNTAIDPYKEGSMSIEAKTAGFVGRNQPQSN